jgi:hypothetical protein
MDLWLAGVRSVHAQGTEKERAHLLGPDRSMSLRCAERFPASTETGHFPSSGDCCFSNSRADETISADYEKFHVVATLSQGVPNRQSYFVQME